MAASRKGADSVIREIGRSNHIRGIEGEFAGGARFRIGAGEKIVAYFFPRRAARKLGTGRRRHLYLAVRDDRQVIVRFLQAEVGHVVSEIVERIAAIAGRGQDGKIVLQANLPHAVVARSQKLIDEIGAAQGGADARRGGEGDIEGGSLFLVDAHMYELGSGAANAKTELGGERDIATDADRHRGAYGDALVERQVGAGETELIDAERQRPGASDRDRSCDIGDADNVLGKREHIGGRIYNSERVDGLLDSLRQGGVGCLRGGDEEVGGEIGRRGCFKTDTEALGKRYGYAGVERSVELELRPSTHFGRW